MVLIAIIVVLRISNLSQSCCTAEGFTLIVRKRVQPKFGTINIVFQLRFGSITNIAGDWVQRKPGFD